MITIQLYDKTNQELTITFGDRPKEYLYCDVSEFKFKMLQKAITNRNNSAIQILLKSFSKAEYTLDADAKDTAL